MNPEFNLSKFKQGCKLHYGTRINFFQKLTTTRKGILEIKYTIQNIYAEQNLKGLILGSIPKMDYTFLTTIETYVVKELGYCSSNYIASEIHQVT